jgi:hypothetical protein
MRITSAWVVAPTVLEIAETPLVAEKCEFDWYTRHGVL